MHAQRWKQIAWTASFWLGVLLACDLIWVAVLADVEFGSLSANFVVSCALLLSTYIGASRATLLLAAREDLALFAKATATTRVLLAAIAVLFVLNVVVFGPSSSAPGSDLATELAATEAALLSVVGLGSLLAVFGPGYTDYHEALKRQGEAATDPDDLPNVPAHRLSRFWQKTQWVAFGWPGQLALCVVLVFIGLAFERHTGLPNCVLQPTSTGTPADPSAKFEAVCDH